MSRYLKRQHSLTREALDRLLAEEPVTEQSATPAEHRPSMHEARIQNCSRGSQEHRSHARSRPWVWRGKAPATAAGRSPVCDNPRHGCVLALARTREGAVELDELPERQRARIELVQGSLTYRDQRLSGFDAAAVVEVIEHLDAPRLATFARNLFEFARPQHVVLTTPNAEYNKVFGTLPAGEFRHGDHRFEWTRAQFEQWTGEVASRFGYTVPSRTGRPGRTWARSTDADGRLR